MADKEEKQFRKETLRNYADLQKKFKEAYDKAKKENNVVNLKKLVSFKDNLAQKVKSYNKNKVKIKDLASEVDKGFSIVNSIMHPILTFVKSEKKTDKEETLEKIDEKVVKKEEKQEKDYKPSSPTNLLMTKNKIDLNTRIPTGILHFDDLIEGGFKRNSANLVVGNAGSGKTIFAVQFLISGLKKGENCLFVTFEEKKEHFFNNMKNFGWDLSKYEAEGRFTFLEYSPAKVKTMLDEGGGAIETIIVKEKITRIVIDSITSFALLFSNELQKREAALSLFNMIGNWNCTSLITFEGEPFVDQKMAARTIEFESDSIILFYYLQESGERHRYLEILKMRGTKHSKKMYRFHIDKEGIIVYEKPITDIKLKQ